MWAKESVSAYCTKMCLSAGSAVSRAGGGGGGVVAFGLYPSLYNRLTVIHSLILWQPRACRGKNRIPQNHGHFKERRCMMYTERAGEGGGGGGWHKALVVDSVSLWRRLLASRPCTFCYDKQASVLLRASTCLGGNPECNFWIPWGGGGGVQTVL